MPSHDHEILIELLRQSPEVIRQLFAELSDAIGQTDRVEVASESFSLVKASAHAADLTLKVFENDTLKHGVIVEIQLEQDKEKLLSWPLYAVGLRAALKGVPTFVLVITPSASVARWAERPIELGAGSVFQTVVLGPETIPALLDLEQAMGSPGLAFLSALAHASDPPETAAKVAFNAIEAAKQLNPRLFVACCDILQSKLDSRALAQLEKLMGFQLDVNKIQTESIRRNVIAGQVLAFVDALLDTLEARGVAVTPEQRERIKNCSEPEALRAWHRKALVITSADELFED